MPNAASLATASPPPTAPAEAVRFLQPKSVLSTNKPVDEGINVNSKLVQAISQHPEDGVASLSVKSIRSDAGPVQKDSPPLPRLKRHRSDDDHPNARAGGPVATPKKLCLRERVARLRTARAGPKPARRGLMKREEEAGETTEAEAEVEREGEALDGRLAGLMQELQETEAKRIRLEEELEAMLAEVEQLEEGLGGVDAKREARKE